MGSLLFFLLVLQIFSGVMLVPFYSSSFCTFVSVQLMMVNIYYGYFVRLFHINFVRLIFLVVYLHLFKGLLLSAWKIRGV